MPADGFHAIAASNCGLCWARRNRTCAPAPWYRKLYKKCVTEITVVEVEHFFFCGTFKRDYK